MLSYGVIEVAAELTPVEMPVLRAVQMLAAPTTRTANSSAYSTVVTPSSSVHRALIAFTFFPPFC